VNVINEALLVEKVNRAKAVADISCDISFHVT
jgi:hypothetical protein